MFNGIEVTRIQVSAYIHSTETAATDLLAHRAVNRRFVGGYEANWLVGTRHYGRQVVDLSGRIR